MNLILSLSNAEILRGRKENFCANMQAKDTIMVRNALDLIGGWTMKQNPILCNLINYRVNEDIYDRFYEVNIFS